MTKVYTVTFSEPGTHDAVVGIFSTMLNACAYLEQQAKERGWAYDGSWCLSDMKGLHSTEWVIREYDMDALIDDVLRKNSLSDLLMGNIKC